jgi:hypothetical protein
VVWVAESERTYHLIRSCLQIGRSLPDDRRAAAATTRMVEIEARRRGHSRCYACYGSRGRTA